MRRDRQRPVGGLLGIQPWNYPLDQVVRLAAPKLVAGNTVLLKHPEVCPQTALALEQLFADAGAPDGVYTNVFLASGRGAGDAHRPCRALGNRRRRAGAEVAEIAGRHLKKCVLELGGSDPFIVLDAAGDGGLQHILDEAAAARLSNTGQSCAAASEDRTSRSSTTSVAGWAERCRSGIRRRSTR